VRTESITDDDEEAGREKKGEIEGKRRGKRKYVRCRDSSYGCICGGGAYEHTAFTISNSRDTATQSSTQT
jgi:hypothetical protein